MDVHAIDVGLTPQAHDHHKRVGLEIDLRGHLHHHAVNDEVWAVDELRYGLRAVVAAAILGPHLVVDGVARSWICSSRGLPCASLRPKSYTR